MITEMPDLPEAACRCFDPEDIEETGCVCGDSERVLRAIHRGEIRLTDDQREWCFREIDRVEGYSREEYALSDDGDLANTVLCAWTDFCRDKGLL
ncbi:hypothetical protein [Bradyrhizobium sp. I71]|uniref:hypothetical protein n=1 Tax=Bradyrhizobium sp. I71 TaxID=2590772 RepID=UPI001EF7D7DA|nr:hypothetical protein [Bradyrhizobium sp. I71]ULK98896.1 hypothetical protein FJV43_03885 [Bradyrhizobium sp. I71]